MADIKQLQPKEYSKARKEAIEEMEKEAVKKAERYAFEKCGLKRNEKVVFVCTKCRSHKQKNPTVYKIIKPGCEHNWKVEN